MRARAVDIMADTKSPMARTRILVVDDEPDILELVQYYLGKAQYDVVGVASGEEALVQVARHLLASSCWT